MKRESKKPQDQQDDRNSPEHGLTLLFETRFVQVIFLTLSLGQAYMAVFPSGGRRATSPLCARRIQVIDPLLRSGPNVISAEFCDTDKATDSNPIWLLQLHKTGIGSATLRVIDRTVLPLAVTFLRKARYKNKPNNRKLAFRWIRIVDIGLLFPFSRRRLAQSHDLAAKSASTFEQLKDGIGTPPESDRGCSLGRRNCGQS
jgi:hypothetical protein